MAEQSSQEHSTTFQPLSIALGAWRDSAQLSWKTQVQAIESMQRFAVWLPELAGTMMKQTRPEPLPRPVQPFWIDLGTLQKSAQLSRTAQAYMLERTQLFADDWFQRRAAGVQSWQETNERMRAAKTPVEFFHAYQLWLLGGFQRLLADGLVFQEGMKTIVAEMTPPLAPKMTEERGVASDSRTKNKVAAKT